MNTTEKEAELCKYLEGCVNSRYTEWDDFFTDTSLNRKYGIYLLKHGCEMMDLINNIQNNIENHLIVSFGQKLIPSKFSYINQLLFYLQSFNEIIQNDSPYVEENLYMGKTPIILYTN